MSTRKARIRETVRGTGSRSGLRTHRDLPIIRMVPSGVVTPSFHPRNGNLSTRHILIKSTTWGWHFRGMCTFCPTLVPWSMIDRCPLSLWMPHFPRLLREVGLFPPWYHDHRDWTRPLSAPSRAQPFLDEARDPRCGTTVLSLRPRLLSLPHFGNIPAAVGACNPV